jgi:hypothetical protein
MALVCDGSGVGALRGYWRTQDGIVRSAISDWATNAFVLGAKTLTIGNDTYGEWADVRVASAKVFDRGLSVQELRDEWASFEVVYPGSCLASLPLVTAEHSITQDVTGTGDFTAFGQMPLVGEPPPLDIVVHRKLSSASAPFDSQIIVPASLRIKQHSSVLGKYVLAENNIDKIKAENDVDFILMEEYVPSIIANASIRISVSFEGEITKPSSIRVKISGEEARDASIRVAALSEIVANASARIARLSEITEAASARIALQSQTTKDTSLRVKINSQIIEEASLQIALQNEIIKNASLQVALNSEITKNASLRVALSTLIQEGFRFRYDDNDEANATWYATQDTNITSIAGVIRRLRILTDTTGNAGLFQRKLWVRRISPSTTPWRVVEVE